MLNSIQATYHPRGELVRGKLYAGQNLRRTIARNFRTFLADCRRSDIRAENNFAAGITTNFLIAGAITKLGPRCTALKAFSRSNDVDPEKPLASGILKFNTTVQDGCDTQTNATDFSISSDSTLTGPTIAVNQYTQGLHLTNAQLNSGIRMADLIEAKLGSFLSAKSFRLSPRRSRLRTSNVTRAASVSSAAFGFSDLATLQGQLQKSESRIAFWPALILRTFPTRLDFSKRSGTLDGLENAWRAFGWDLIGLNTEWQGADPYVQGFACNPQAIGVICGLPLDSGRRPRDSNWQGGSSRLGRDD